LARHTIPVGQEPRLPGAMCGQCGAAVEPDASFCTQCGTANRGAGSA
jgi:uncharacterized OB-fold protein